MSTSVYKVEYECDCGIDYGSCEAKCAIILKSQNSCDIYTLYHTDGHRYLGNDKEPKTEKGGLECFGDNYISALIKLLALKDSNEEILTDNEKKIIFNRS